MSLLAVSSLVATHGLLKAVSGVDLDVERGERLAIVGANGAGKTTLMRCLAGAHPVASGHIAFEGVDITALSSHKRAAQGVALVPEGRRLFAAMTVEENLRLALQLGRKGEWTFEAVMDAFPNLKERRKARAGSLSGGEQQATAIGRALLTNPTLLLLDEVSLGLSPLAVDRVYASLDRLKSLQTTILVVEQDLGRAFSFATRIVCMLEGRVALAGDPKTLTRGEVTQAYFGMHRDAGAAT